MKKARPETPAELKKKEANKTWNKLAKSYVRQLGRELYLQGAPCPLSHDTHHDCIEETDVEAHMKFFVKIIRSKFLLPNVLCFVTL